MEKLTTLMICDSIENKIQGKTVVPAVIAPQLVLRPLFIPSAISFALVLGISGMDLKRQNAITVKIKNPADEVIQEIVDNSLPPSEDDPELSADYAGCMMFVDIRNMIITASGEYPVEVYVNGSKIGDAVIPVFKRTRK